MDFDFTTETITPDTTNILTIGGTGGLELSIGTTAQRPLSPINGTLRYNTDLSTIEGFSNGSWTSTVNQGTITSINVSGGTTGLSTTGGPITTSGTITLTGTLATSNGGTGLTAIGSSLQVLRVNAAGTSLEYATISVASGTVTSVAATQPAAGLTISGSPITTSGTFVFALANDLAEIEGLSTNGIAVRTATDTWTTRTISAGTGISVSNGDGISGNPAITNTGVTSISFSGTGLTPNTATSGAVTVAGTLDADNGGTGQSSYAVGDILYANTTSTLARLADIATGNALISGGVNTAPSWGKIGLTTHVSGILPIVNGGTNLSTTPTNGQLLIGNGTNYTLSTLTAGTGISVNNASGSITINATNNGTVTSVGLALPSIFSVSGSPVTTSGTLTGTLATQSANTFFVGPVSGGAATPTFRTVGIDELSDVVITTPSTNQVIAYNGSNWVNTGAVGSNATGTIGVSPSGGGTAWTLVSGNLYTANFVHNLGTTNLTITVYDTSDNSVVTPQNVSTPNTTTITVTAIGNTKTLKVVAVANGQSIVAGGSTPSSVITAYEGVTISAAATKLNFQGAGVGVVDAGSGTTNITIGQRYTYFAAALDTPVNSDFAVNSLAPMIADPTYISLNVRSFSNSDEQGVATLVSIPTGATKVTFKIRGRAQTAPGTASVVQPRIYYRLLPNNSAVPAWSAAQELANISIPTNANFQYGQQTVNLSTLGMTAGNMYQIELTRRVTGVTGTNLASAFLMAEFTMEFA